jgi:hypothetical protein
MASLEHVVPPKASKANKPIQVMKQFATDPQ